jgi:hypothetical protein
MDEKTEGSELTGSTQTQSAINFLINQILICYCHSQISECFHISHLYVIILPCILVMRHQHTVTCISDYRWVSDW